MPWKIARNRDPFGHYVGLDAGIRYVTAARETSSDPVIRGNADRDPEDTDTTRGRRTFPAGVDRVEGAAGRRGGVLHARCGWWTHDTGRHACALVAVRPAGLTLPGDDHGGEGLRGQPCLNRRRQHGRCHGGVHRFARDRETASIEPGRLPPGGIKVRNDFTLILTNVPSPRAAGDGVAGASGASPVSKIDGPVPPPHITVGAAIRYVTELRDKTTADRIRKNAGRALVFH